jgi:outer membrane protein assembly factor BamB
VKVISTAFLALCLLVGSAHASDAEALLKATGNRGGICLIIGAKDPALAGELASKSALYVQLLQSDAKTAAAWGTKAAVAPYRENIGVRNAGFDAAHYGSDLFNLVVMLDGKTKLADLYRILVPGGVVAFKSAPGSLAAEAKALKMTSVSVAGFAAAFRNPVKPVVWKLPLATKWRAGPRSQIARGYAGITIGDGRLFYLERMELDKGDLRACAAQLFARDAYNGRTLWTRQVPGGWRNLGMAANSKGRLYVMTGERKVLCLDGATGKLLGEVAVKPYNGARVRFLNDEVLCVAGRVYSSATNKYLWRFPSYAYLPLRGSVIGKSVCFSDSKAVSAKELATGKELWKVPLEGLAGPNRMSAIGRKYLLVNMTNTKKDPTAFRFAILDAANGKKLWDYSWKVRTSKREIYFSAGHVKYATIDGKLLLFYRHNKPGSYADEVVITKLDLATGKEEVKDRILGNAGDFHGCFGERHLGDYIGWYDLWVNKKTLKSTLVKMPHPACFFGSSNRYGLVYNFPSRKSGPISAVGPADITYEKAPGGKVLKAFGSPSSSAATAPGDWPMFRGGVAGGNFTKANPGDKLTKAWEVQVGLGKTNFGVMSSQRTGLSQAVLGYGLAVVADIDAQRIVALNASDGKQKWAFHVGSRVDYPPTLYKGRCLVAARDGWVYCLDVLTGKLLYKLLVAARERYTGTREKLESRWPISSDVLIIKGVAYVSGGAGGLAFNPETGQVVSAKNASGIALGRARMPGGRDLMISYDMMLKGNSIPRTNEDNKHGFRRQKFKRKLDARVLAFDGSFTAAYKFGPRGEGWANKGTLFIEGIAGNPKKPLWKTPPIELVVADMVLTPKYIYCAGHYQRVKKAPELWVVSRKDGKVLSKTPVEGFPAFMGMSAAGKRLFVATRDGKLICFKAE